MTKNVKVPVDVQPQQAFDFGALSRADEEHRKSMRALEDIYDATSNLVLAGATGIDKGDLKKMFEAGSGRHMRFKAALQIATFGGHELRQRVALPFVRCLGFGLGDPVPMSADEKALRLELKLKSLGDLGVQAYNEAMGGLP